MSATKRPDTFLALAAHGNVSELLRQVASRIDSGAVTVENFSVRLQADSVELSMLFDTTEKRS